MNEVEQSGHEAQAVEARLKAPAGQDFLLAILHSVAVGSLSADVALPRIHFWLESGKKQKAEAEPVTQYEYA